MSNINIISRKINTNKPYYMVKVMPSGKSEFFQTKRGVDSFLGFDYKNNPFITGKYTNHVDIKMGKMNKILTGLLVIVIGVTGIAVVDGFSEGLMTSVESTTQTETDYTGVLSDVSFLLEDSEFADTETNDLCLSNNESFLGLSINTTGEFAIYKWNDTSEIYEVLAEFTPPAGVPYACAFNSNDTLLMVSTSASPYIYMYDISGSTFTVSTDTILDPSAYVYRLVFGDDTHIAYVGGSSGSAKDFRIMEKIGSSWNNNVLAIDNGTAYDIDTFSTETDIYYVSSKVTAPYINVVKNDTSITVTDNPSAMTLSIGVSNDFKIALAGNETLTILEFDTSTDDTNSMTVTSQPVVIGEIYSVQWLGNNHFILAGTGGTLLYSFDGTAWDIEDNIGWTHVKALSYASSKGLMIVDRQTTTESYTTTLTTTGDSITLENTPDSITSVTHNGVSKAYTLLGTELTPTNPELSGDLLVVYDYEITGDYPLLNIVPIVFAVAVLGFVVSLIIFKRE